jgi:hypothetical protein
MFILRERDEFMAVKNPETQVVWSASGDTEEAREGMQS